MSGLARVLAHRVPPGVYHWTSATGTADAEHAAEHAGWRFVLLDTWGVDDKAGFLASCHAAFDFPDWFGRNFDALSDALSDIRSGDSEGVLVLWEGWGPLARADARVFDVAVDVFGSRVDFERAGPFVVLLHGPGPETQVRELDATT